MTRRLSLADSVTRLPVRRRLPLGLAASAIVLIGASVALGSAPALADSDVDDFTFASYDADYYLTRADDGSSRLTTVETLVAEFPETDQNKGIIRAIPLDFEGADLGLAVESVTDAEGAPVPYTESDDEGFREVSIGTDDYVRGDQTYVITYDQRNVIRAYDDTAADEFYWDLNGTGWEQPFGSVTGRVHVPSALAGSLTGSSACYSGGVGSTDSCAVEEGTDAEGSVFTVSADGIDAEQTVTIAIGFERGTFAEPERARDQAWVVALPAVTAGLGVVLAAIAAVLRRTRWRDARGRGIVVAQYERPPSIDLLAAGDILGRSTTSMSAELMDLAVRGNLRIIDRTPVGEESDRKFSLEFVSFEGLNEPERRVMRAVFGTTPDAGFRKKIGTSAETGRRLQKQVANTRDRVVEKGWRRPVSRASTGLIAVAAVAVAITAVVVFVILVAVNGLTIPGVLLLAAALAIVVLAIVAASKRSAVTAEGAGIRDHLDGMRDYIQLAEADRLRMLQSPEGAERRGTGGTDPAQIVRVYERLLPFAILYGVEKQWARELEHLYSAAGDSPYWYSGAHPFDSGAFTGFLVSSQAQASASTWSSSGSGSSFGGSTGGGFAGGGGGGGGGGGR